jgi:HEAT repeat protein
VALFGLSEVGEPDDADIVDAYLADPRPAARRAAVWALAGLQGADALPVLLGALDDPSSSVVGAASRALARHRLPWAELDDLWQRHSSGSGARQRALFRVVAAQARWPRLVLACRAVLSDDPEVAARGVVELQAVQDSWNRAQTPPQPMNLDEVRRLAPEVRARVPSRTADELDDVLRHAA